MIAGFLLISGIGLLPRYEGAFLMIFGKPKKQDLPLESLAQTEEKDET